MSQSSLKIFPIINSSGEVFIKIFEFTELDYSSKLRVIKILKNEIIKRCWSYIYNDYTSNIVRKILDITNSRGKIGIYIIHYILLII